MGGITGILIIVIIFLLVSGKSNLPDVGTGLGRSIRNFKRSLHEREEIDVTPREERIKREQNANGGKDQNS
jgi:Sec-independent protein secretion pathway components